MVSFQDITFRAMAGMQLRLSAAPLPVAWSPAARRAHAISSAHAPMVSPRLLASGYAVDTI
jgi:hypothetical protein